MPCMTAEQYAAAAMRKKADAMKRHDWKMVREAEREVELACKAIRARGANWLPPMNGESE